MNDFPLTPFLLALQADDIRTTLSDYERIITVLRAGGPWSVHRLRGVLMALLVHSREQEEAFAQRFDSFFDLSLETPYTREEIARALENLRRLAGHRAGQPTPPPTPVNGRATTAPPARRPVEPKRFRLRRRHVVAASILLALALPIGVGIYFQYFRPAPGVQGPGGGGGKTGDDGEVSKPSGSQPAAGKELVASVEATMAGIVQLPVGRTWKDVAGVVALVVALLSLALLLYLWLKGKLNADDRPDWNPRGPRHFPLSSITDPPPQHLDSETLDQIADSFGYFQSDRPSRLLDVEASVKAAGRNCGLPVLLYQKRRQLRSIYILEDAYAEPLSWNPVSRELADGLGRRGIKVKYGKFYGSPDKFHLADGTVEWLEDMEDRRGNYMLLLFSDGKSLSPNRDAFLLEALARWPLVAWMELREQRFWDESAALPASYGIPVHHASRAGLLAAVQRFLTESGTADSRSQQESSWRGAPANVGTDLAAYVERLLGDALPWAQASAMLQPITVGMAHALRREFLNHLPPARVERLFLLPGTTRSVAGLRFSIPVLAVLRSGFASRWDERKQEEVIRFILRKIEELEPAEKDSLRHLAWEYSLERVRLELEPDKALERLTRLEKTPLGGAIRAELENVILPGVEPVEGHTQVPLRLKPESQKALRQLVLLAPDAGYVLYGVGDGLRRLLRALRLLWDKCRGLPPALAAWFRRLLDEARILLGAADDAGGDAARGIVIDPPRLVIRKSVRRNERYFRLPRISVSGDVNLLTAVVSTDSSNWLCVEGDRPLIRAELPPERRFERLIVVLADMRELQSGRHEGNVIVSVSGDDLPIPIELIVTHGIREQIALWWQQNRRGWPIRVAFASALLVALTYFATAALRPDWINRLYNHPPALNAINLPDPTLQKDDRLELVADATDPDGDQVNYDWETEGGSVDEQDQIAFLNVAGREPPPGAGRAQVAVNVRLTDSRGGRASYRAMVDLVTSEPKPKPNEREVIAPSDAPTTASSAPTSTAKPPEGIQAIVNEDNREALQVSVRGVSSNYFTRFSVRPRGRRVLRLPSGEYRISVQIENDSLANDDSLTVTPGANEPYMVGPSIRQISVHSNILGAKLYVDGRYQGVITRKKNIYLVEGRYKIEVKKPEYITWTDEVEVGFEGSLHVAPEDTDLVANLEIDPNSELFGYYERARKESDLGNYDEALGIVKEGLRKYPSNDDLEELRAEIKSDKAQNLVRGEVKEEVKADYVPGAEAFGGGVKVFVTINAKGDVTSAEAVAGSPPDLRQAVGEAALRWKFEPARPGDSVSAPRRRIILVKFKPGPAPTPTPSP